MRLTSEVARIVRTRPECKYDDVLLAFAVWEAQGLVLTDEQRQLLAHLSKPGSMLRIRARVRERRAAAATTSRRN